MPKAWSWKNWSSLAFKISQTYNTLLILLYLFLYSMPLSSVQTLKIYKCLHAHIEGCFLIIATPNVVILENCTQRWMNQVSRFDVFAWCITSLSFQKVVEFRKPFEYQIKKIAHTVNATFLTHGLWYLLGLPSIILSTRWYFQINQIRVPFSSPVISNISYFRCPL